MHVQDKLIEFVRRDGQLDAPIAFLTIEDGGIEPTAERLDASLAESEAWVPQVAAELDRDLGTPGVIIPKLMTLFASNGQAIGDWRQYRGNMLYLKNELNLKFYPIARPNQDDGFSEEIIDYMGLSDKQYIRWCKRHRPAVLARRFGDILKQKELVVILGERPGWVNVLRTLYPEARQQDYRDEKGKFLFSLYFDPDDNLLFAYTSMFRGVSDSKLEHFSCEISKFKTLSTVIKLPTA